jgi:hypothetical protein
MKKKGMPFEFTNLALGAKLKWFRCIDARRYLFMVIATNYLSAD